jgi:glycosyltransferase involved in cell wall biosynthesis
VRALVFAEGVPEAWIPTLVSLREVLPEVPIVLGAESPEACDALGSFADVVVEVDSAATLVEQVYLDAGAHLLVVVAPTIFPREVLGRALELVEEDLRCSSVSFLSNAGDFASFPNPGEVSIHRVGSLDEEAATSLLRAEPEGLEPVPIPYPVGPAVLISAQGLSLVRPFPQHGVRLALALADYGASARARGMLDLLDPATFVTRPLDLPGDVPIHAGLAPDEVRWLEQRHPGVTTLIGHRSEEHSALNEALAMARVALTGIRLIIDGTCLMPQEMGHQVTFLAMLTALAERNDVSYLGVVLNGPAPSYAREALSHPKVDAKVAPLATLDGFPQVDVVHRPFQVTEGVDLSRWRRRGSRTALTIHDVIAFQIGDYFSSAASWHAHREVTRRAAADVDGVIAISEDTRSQIVLERLGVDASRIFVVPNGVGHLSGDEPAVEPTELLARGFSGEPFLLVLGTNYSHKNRDLAIAVAREVRSRGFNISLVMAGAHVGMGSSRVAEARQWEPDEPVVIIPDVTSQERNWLLRHASAVLYPTGAEGFGLVPHEAAAFGTPTVMVPIPALAERLAHIPVLARDWSVRSFADATASLLSDPALAAATVRAIKASLPDYDWDQNAELTIKAFKSLLARPPVARI